ncbi:1-phosphatidylinositol 4,5-bisphosphate phosphodiesterase zeta-1 isoform X2 [Engystomops pustulosus]|uniref:1-phosphatidylinositol 4,5-bisphosphate phosphodiesterase zeta-1 isoform X2 n=1 Tax=Engystomops pustulosus TaxID=76066 RepID=UPI003AFA2C11
MLYTQEQCRDSSDLIPLETFKSLYKRLVYPAGAAADLPQTLRGARIHLCTETSRIPPARAEPRRHQRGGGPTAHPETRTHAGRPQGELHDGGRVRPLHELRGGADPAEGAPGRLPGHDPTPEQLLRVLLTQHLPAVRPDTGPEPPVRLQQALKGKILIKHKKAGLLQDTILSPAPSAQGQVEEYEEVEDTKNRRLSMNLLRRTTAESTTNPETQGQKMKISMALSDLVIYTKSQKFISFQHSRENQKFYEINSLTENVARKLARHHAPEFIQHTRNFITRIYPRGTRTDSSNFCPHEFWSVGCQMVAINFQTPGIPMDLQGGKFLDNGRCGYVLKPEYLRTERSKVQPYEARTRRRPKFFIIKVISGFLLPHGSLSTTPSLIVRVEIYGIPADEGRKQTNVVKNNAFNPQWNQSLTFSLQLPELVLIRFCLEDQHTLIPNEMLGQYTLPLTSMAKGYRHIPLLNKHGQSLAPASLFIHVWY